MGWVGWNYINAVAELKTTSIWDNENIKEIN